MTNIIITGHGHFPTGLLSAIELVGGKPDLVTAIDFTEGMSSQELKTSMRQAIDNASDSILILADLVGGTPFQTAAMLIQEHPDRAIKVIAGANMPATVEAVFSRNFASFDDLIGMVKTAGTSGITDLGSLAEPSEEPEFEGGL